MVFCNRGVLLPSWRLVDVAPDLSLSFPIPLNFISLYFNPFLVDMTKGLFRGVLMLRTHAYS